MTDKEKQDGDEKQDENPTKEKEETISEKSESPASLDKAKKPQGLQFLCTFIIATRFFL